MRKRSLTLLEIVIALGIMSLLCLVTFPHLRQTLHFKKHFEIEQSRVFSRAHVQTRLGSFLAKIEPGELFETEQLEKNSIALVFGLNNQKDFDGAYYGRVTASLSLDQDRLLLSIKGKGDKTREEVLMEGIADIKWMFSYITEKNSIEMTPEWSGSDLPLFCLLEMRLSDGRKETFYFRLKSAERLGYPT